MNDWSSHSTEDLGKERDTEEEEEVTEKPKDLGKHRRSEARG